MGRTGTSKQHSINQHRAKLLQTFIRGHEHASPEAGATRPSQHAHRCSIRQEITPAQTYTQLPQGARHKGHMAHIAGNVLLYLYIFKLRYMGPSRGTWAGGHALASAGCFRPSDLLSRTMRFSKLISYTGKCSCGQTLIQFATHGYAACSCSKRFLCDVHVRRAQQQLAQTCQ
jgi:hypothetical protein